MVSFIFGIKLIIFCFNVILNEAIYDFFDLLTSVYSNSRGARTGALAAMLSVEMKSPIMVMIL